MSCKHPTKYEIIDEHEGDIICMQCGLVLDKHYNETRLPLQAEPSSYPTYILNDSTLLHLGENFHFSKDITHHACQIYKSLPVTKITTEKQIRYAYCFYYACKECNAPRCMWEIASLMKIDSAKLYKLDKQLQSRITPISPAALLSRQMSNYLSYKDIQSIKKIIEELPITLTQGLKPQTITSGCILYYCERNGMAIKPTEIAKHFNTNIKTQRKTSNQIKVFFSEA